MKRICLALAIAATGCGDNSHEGEIASLHDTIEDLQQDIDQAQGQLAQVTQERDALARKLEELELKVNPAVTLEMPFTFGSQPLQLGTPYAIAGGDTVSFREVRYWLSNVSLQRSDGAYVPVPDGYYLVEARPEQPLTNGTEAAVMLPAARRETVTLKGIPSGTYVGIRFHVGVDPQHNDDLSVTAGELHTLKNMTFDNGWMWFTSYIFTRTRADLAGAGGNAVMSWDNGSNADLREVELSFPSALALSAGVGYTVRVRADLETLVTSVSPRQRLVIDAGTSDDRTLLADSFRDMFVMASAALTP